MPRAVLKKIFFIVFNRCYILYLAIILFAMFGVDHQKVIFKTLDAFRRAEYDVIHQAQGHEVMKDFILRDAIRYYRNIIALIPDSAIAHSLLGFCYYQAEEYGAAIKHYQEAIALEDDYFGLYYNLGVIHYQLGQYEPAIENFEKGLAVDPVKTLGYAGLINPFNPEEFADSQERFRASRIAMLKNAYAGIYRYLVLSYFQLNNNQAFLSAAIKAAQMDLKFKDFFYYYATIAAYRLEDYPLAVRFASAAIQQNPEHQDVYRYLGLSFEKMGLAGLAQNAFSQEKVLLQSQSPGPTSAFAEKQPLFLYTLDAKAYFFRKQKENELTAIKRH